jgi:hypothetical protein
MRFFVSGFSHKTIPPGALRPNKKFSNLASNARRYWRFSKNLRLCNTAVSRDFQSNYTAASNDSALYYTAPSQIATLVNTAASQIPGFPIENSPTVLCSSKSHRTAVSYSGESYLATVLCWGALSITAVLYSGES